MRLLKLPKYKMVGVVEIASTSQVVSFVHYAQDLLRLPQYPGYTPIIGGEHRPRRATILTR
jgi:hypothetical protein